MLAVNIKTKEILALEVTDEKVHDGKVMKQLIEQVLNNNHNIKMKSFIGDAGAYDSNENFKYLEGEKDSAYHQSKKKLHHFIHENNKIRNREVNFKQRIITNGKRKESMDNDGWLKKQHFLL